MANYILVPVLGEGIEVTSNNVRNYGVKYCGFRNGISQYVAVQNNSLNFAWKVVYFMEDGYQHQMFVSKYPTQGIVAWYFEDGGLTKDITMDPIMYDETTGLYTLGAYRFPYSDVTYPEIYGTKREALDACNDGYWPYGKISQSIPVVFTTKGGVQLMSEFNITVRQS